MEIGPIGELSAHPLITSFDVLRYEQEENTVILKLRILLTDASVLHTKEYTDIDTRKYAFHWQQADRTWLVRWDNALHFPNLASFPHHKHDYRSGSETVTDSYDITLSEVLTFIQRQLTHPHP